MTAVPATLIFDLNGRLLYFNSQAFSLLPQIKETLNQPGCPPKLPQEILDLCQKTRSRLHKNLKKGMEEIDQAFLDDPSSPMVMRSFPIGNGVSGRDQTFVLIILEPAIHKATSNRENAAAEFNLTRRELEVTGLILRGLTNPAIAEALYISPQTVKTHLKHIMRKMGVSTRNQIISKLMINQ